MRFRKVVNGTKADAQTLRDLMHARKDGYAQWTFRQDFAYYLENMFYPSRSDLAQRTQHDYKCHRKRCIIPGIGYVLIGSMSIYEI